MAKQEYMYMSGMLKWCRTISPNEWGKYSVVIYPDKEGLELFHKLKEQGLKNDLKKDDDGYYATFSRPNTMDTRSGKSLYFGPPKLLNDKMEDIGGTMVGNGSTGTIKLEVWKMSTGKPVARLGAIMIKDLIPYGVNDMPDKEKKMVKGLENHTEGPKW